MVQESDMKNKNPFFTSSLLITITFMIFFLDTVFMVWGLRNQSRLSYETIFFLPEREQILGKKALQQRSLIVGHYVKIHPVTYHISGNT
jgi:hypothetical protein